VCVGLTAFLYSHRFSGLAGDCKRGFLAGQNFTTEGTEVTEETTVSASLWLRVEVEDGSDLRIADLRPVERLLRAEIIALVIGTEHFSGGIAE
jgi:hypothetical protein